MSRRRSLRTADAIRRSPLHSRTVRAQGRLAGAAPRPLVVQAVLTGGLLAATLWPAEAQAQAAAAPAEQSSPAVGAMRRYDIPAGPLSAVLTRFSADAGIFLVGASEIAQGKHSPGLRGSFSVQAALDALLAGTGLEAQRQAEGRYLLRAAVEGAVKSLPAVTVTDRVDEDEQKRDGVYRENVTNLYVGRKELERYPMHNAADVLKGLTGVYSMDPRNGTALSPNIRGLSGQGRVPVTVDGTEQSTDIWLGVMYGVGNRSYVNPALFRSITVEKGPSLTRGIKSGVGGAISIRTIEPDDIIPEGKNAGIEFKAETAGNTIERRLDPSSYYGQDYRDIPDARINMYGGITIPASPPRERSGSDVLNLEDNSYLLSLAGRNDAVEGLLSYSERRKGNYFAGKRGADKYRNNDGTAHSTEAYFPNTAALYEAGAEVPSTSSDTSTLLLKNNWNLPHDQKLGLSFMRTRLTFGENNNTHALMAYSFGQMGNLTGGAVTDYPDSQIDMDIWRLGYALKPADSRWIDFQSNLWMTRVDGRREQNGGNAYFVNDRDATYDDWVSCKRTGAPVNTSMPGAFLMCLLNPVLRSPTPPQRQPNTDGRYNIVSASTQWTDHKRIGADFSNRIRVSDSLNLTIGGEIQHEKLQEDVLNLYQSGGFGLGPDAASLVAATDIIGPRSGRRHEWAGSVNMDWSPTPWLTLSAGTRYSEFWAFDDGLAERRRNQAQGSQIVQERTGVKLSYGTLMSNQEWTTFQTLQQAVFDTLSRTQPNEMKQWRVQTEFGGHVDVALPTGNAAYVAAWNALADYAAAHNAGSGSQAYAANLGQAIYNDNYGYKYRTAAPPANGVGAGRAMYWNTEVVLPVVNGKVDSSQSPFVGGGVDWEQTATDPQGQTGEYSVRRPGNTSSKGDPVYARPDDGEQWAPPKRRKGHAWSPVLAATVRMTNHASLFGRYAQITRFPSIFEVASTSVGMNTPYLTTGATKPERSTNWEIGYAHDLTPFFPRMQAADVRISWFDTRIRDFIDRDTDLNIIQYDRKETSGVEFQSRFDSGRIFGGMGAVWRKKQKLCDKDYAYGMDVYYDRVPECMTGGFPDTLTASSLQPRYSVNADLGVRLLQNKLEMGARALYHAKAENEQLDELLRGPLGASGIWGGKSVPQYYWHSVLLLDLYARYQVSRVMALNLGVANLTDRYYLDPMAKIPVPGPGRTVSVGVQVQF